MTPTTPLAMTDAAAPEFDRRPPGERYYRHPGDVVRVVLWGVATVVLVLLTQVATGTNDGLRDDVGDAAALVPRAVRELALAGAQVAAILVPVVIALVLVTQRRWRRAIVLLAAAAAGAAALALLDLLVELDGPLPGALDESFWLVPTRFPSPVYLAAASAATTVSKPWLGRAWRRTADRGLLGFVLALALAGRAGPGELLLAVSTGMLAGALVLVIVGAPNRRPSPSAVAAALGEAGVPVQDLTLERAVGGRAQLYRATSPDGATTFVKVYARDSRDADLLYRGYRSALLRESDDAWAGSSLERDVEHEGLALLLARRNGVRCPDLRAVTSLPDGSMIVAMEDIPGRPLDALEGDAVTPELLEDVWRQVDVLHASGVAHRALRARNVVVAGGRSVIVDLGASRSPSTSRLRAIDRAELLSSTATLVGPEAAVSAAARVLDPGDLAAASRYLQPLALSASTRKATPKATLKQLRDGIATETGRDPEPLERLVRVKARTLVMIATLTGAFYFLLPQLANVDDSVQALRSANFAWLAGCVVLSGATYFAAALGMTGGVAEPLPFVPTVHAQLASSFVNRVTPANVGGMALNVRFLQKAGVPSTSAVTGMGLNVLAGGVVHVVLLFVFFAWAGRSDSGGVSLPSSSKLLVVIAVVLAVLGVVLATRRGRHVLRTKVWSALKESVGSIGAIARSPGRLLALFGGSLGVTLAYIAALTCATNAFDGSVSFAEVGAVYLGASLLAAAAPTPGGLGAMEAALVAGFTAIGMDGGVAVATVLSYRLATYWLPILPGWLSFRLLDRRSFI